MKGEQHYKRAKEIIGSINVLVGEDMDKHVAAIVEQAYGAVHHLIAYGMDKKYGIHSDTHTGVSRILREHGEHEIGEIFDRLGSLRHGRWYGGKGNGEIVKECLSIISKVEEWTE